MNLPDFIQIGLRNILIGRDLLWPRPTITIQTPSQMLSDVPVGPYNITGFISGNGSSLVRGGELHWFCYQGSQSGVIPGNSESTFSIPVQVQPGENLFTLTICDQAGQVISNGVVIIGTEP